MRFDRLPGQAILELDVNGEDMPLNPGCAVFMEIPQHFWAAAFIGQPAFEIRVVPQKLLVRKFVLRICRTLMPLHATFFMFEMHCGVRLHEVHEVDYEFHLLTGGVRGMRHAIQLIDIIYQQLVLKINLRMPGFKFFSPL